MKKIITAIIITMLLTITALADDARVVIGGDLTDEQIASVYADFGINRGDVTEIILTNAIEREYLEGIVSEEMLGTKSISCAYVKLIDGEVSVSANNTNYCTASMYLSSMATAGIDNVEVVVTAPFEVSGTAALVGIYLAYEDMTGTTLESDAKIAAVTELFTSAGLAEGIDSTAVLTLVNELKLNIEDFADMSDEEIITAIDKLAESYDITLTDYHYETLLKMIDSMKKLDSTTLVNTVEKVKDTLETMGEYKDKAVSIWTAIADFFAAIANFFTKIWEIFA